MHDIRDNYCILAIFFVSLHCVRRKAALGKVQASLTLLSFALSLHCHSLRTANGKLTTKKRRELSHVVQVRDEGPKGQKQHALKGQKLLAQGIALGIVAVSKAPCKGKSFAIFAWGFKAFALTGRQACVHDYPGRCPGLGASALSGRVGCSCHRKY